MGNVAYCPCCGYAVSIETLVEAKYDYDCPRCTLAKLSEFQTEPGSSYPARFLTDDDHPLDGEIVLALEGRRRVEIVSKYVGGEFLDADGVAVDANAWRPIASTYKRRAAKLFER